MRNSNNQTLVFEVSTVQEKRMSHLHTEIQFIDLAFGSHEIERNVLFFHRNSIL